MKKKQADIKSSIKKNYGEIAQKGTSCCCSCGGNTAASVVSKGIGYTDQELNAVPEGANLGLGCGNPVALASIKPGETVLDLGSGAGFDCFLAAKRTGPTGKVIGVDMTPEMIARARNNAEKGGYQNVTFVQGEIEHLPVADGAVDLIISNCVINLSTDKDAVFREAYRVLKVGGRIMVSDIVLLKELPPAIKKSVDAYVGCLSGAMLQQDYLAAIKAAGFQNIELLGSAVFPMEDMLNDPTAKAIAKDLKLTDAMLKSAEDCVVSAKIKAVK